jgi:RND family efflux transporter MFP subunit
MSASSSKTSLRAPLAAWVLLLVSSCNEPAKKPAPPPKEVELLTLQPSELRDSREYLGTIISRQNVSLLPQVAGYVKKILVRPGDKVEKGQVVLEVDARQESADLTSAQAQERAADANRNLAQSTLNRTEALLREGLVAGQELERSQTAAQAAEEAYKSARALVYQRQVGVQFFAVRAPFAGLVGDITVRVGDFVTASTPLTSLTQSSSLELRTTIPAERARDVRLGTPLEILDSSGKVTLTAPIYFVGAEADRATQMVDVLASIENPSGLRPQELVRARVVYSTRSALQVPAMAVVRQSGQAFVFAATEREGNLTVSRRPVTLGPLGEQAYVVESGLQAGDRIAVSSLQALRDGAPIRPKRPAGETAATDAATIKARE